MSKTKYSNNELIMRGKANRFAALVLAGVVAFILIFGFGASALILTGGNQ